MKHLKLFSLFGCIFILASCSSDDQTLKDEDKPTITLNYAGGFPQTCATLKKGETYVFKARVSDNQALAAYSLNLHHNFDHHTHDDQGATCDLDPVKEAVNPLIYMENYKIEGGLTEYEIEIPIRIPVTIDSGNYHCSYSVTDITGWQSRTSVDIKISE